MKMKRYITIACIAASIACAAPAPYPVLVTTKLTRHQLLRFIGAMRLFFKLRFQMVKQLVIYPKLHHFFAVSSNNVSAAFVTGSVSVREESIGIVNFTFQPDIILWDTGNYEYQCGAWLSNGNPHVFNRGILKVQGSPAGR